MVGELEEEVWLTQEVGGARWQEVVVDLANSSRWEVSPVAGGHSSNSLLLNRASWEEGAESCNHSNRIHRQEGDPLIHLL